MKTEWLYSHRFKDRQEAELAVFEYIQTWYNTRRRHSSLSYKTTAAFEQFFLHHQTAA
ncbi:MAG: IS3 family transposase [Phaeodactylibacter sp.]|nr:IS3 family transposase [Phaeodactylibacter sp.]